MTSAEALLRLIVALLPERRRVWGRAMRAELASLDTGSARWWFVAGCLRATLAQVSLRSCAGPLVSALAIGGAVAATGTTGYLPLRLTLIAYMSLLVLVAWSGRLASMATAGPRSTRVRVAGMALVGVFAVRVVTGLGGGGDPMAQARTGVPIMAAISVCYLVAVLRMTAGTRAESDAASVIAWPGVAAAGVWTACAIAFPPAPAGISTALTAMAIAASATVAVAARRGLRPVRVVAATAAAIATCALVINIVVATIGQLAPVRFIPLLAGDGSLTAGARVAQSRVELNDPYIAVLFLGALAALGAIIALSSSQSALARTTLSR